MRKEEDKGKKQSERERERERIRDMTHDCQTMVQFQRCNFEMLERNREKRKI